MHRGKDNDWLIRLMATLAVCFALVWIAGCSPRTSDEQIRQQAQQATERAKIEAKKAAAEAKVAAANATRAANDVADGVRAGLRNGHHGHEVDLNSASRTDLETLPGVNATVARHIIAHRPYSTPHDLVRKQVITEDQYGRLDGKVTAQ